MARNTSQNVNVPSGTYTLLHQVTLDPGTWTINGSAAYPSNGTGFRVLAVSFDAGTSSASRDGGCSVPAVNGIATVVRSQKIVRITAQSTLYLIGYQNSGSTLSVGSRIEAVRIC